MDRIVTPYSKVFGNGLNQSLILFDKKMEIKEKNQILFLILILRGWNIAKRKAFLTVVTMFSCCIQEFRIINRNRIELYQMKYTIALFMIMHTFTHQFDK